MKKKIIIGIIILVIITTIMLWPKKTKIIENEYEILENPNTSYKYITTYEQYKEFIDKKDDNTLTKQLTEQDFKNKKYLCWNC